MSEVLDQGLPLDSSELDALVEEAVGLDVDELFRRLGVASVALQRGHLDSSAILADMRSADFAIAIPDPRRIGRRWFRRFEGILHAVLCGTDPKWDEFREAIKEAFNKAGDLIALALAAALAIHLAIVAAIAAVLAALILKLLWKGSLKLLCEQWDFSAVLELA